jgi:hypothetical protein
LVEGEARKAQLEAEETIRISQCERENIQKLYEYFASCSNIDTVEDFNPIEDLLPFGTIASLTTQSDFDIPEEWKNNNDEIAQYCNFRLLNQNLYKPPLQRSMFDLCSPEDIPHCTCTPETGCDGDCTNRILFMFVLKLRNCKPML